MSKIIRIDDFEGGAWEQCKEIDSRLEAAPEEASLPRIDWCLDCEQFEDELTCRGYFSGEAHRIISVPVAIHLGTEVER